MRVEPSDWKPAQNDHIKVSFDRIPSKFGNKYAYYIRHLSLNAAN